MNNANQAFLNELENEGVCKKRTRTPRMSLKMNRFKKRCAICREMVKESQI